MKYFSFHSPFTITFHNYRCAPYIDLIVLLALNNCLNKRYNHKFRQLVAVRIYIFYNCKLLKVSNIYSESHSSNTSKTQNKTNTISLVSLISFPRRIVGFRYKTQSHEQTKIMS